MHTDRILSFAKSLIQIPYVSGSGEIDQAIKLLELVKIQLSEYKFTSFASNQAPSLLFTNSKTETMNFKIILNAHLDVVSGRSDQFTPQETEGRLYGRGAYDMKTAAAIMILLFKELGPQLPYPLGLQIVTDEETGGFNGTKYQINQGVRAQFIIVGEGTDLRIINQSKIRLIIKLTSAGKSAHSGYLWLGENAIWNIQQAIYAFMQAYPLPTEETKATTINIAKIETTNLAHNKVPDNCTAYLDIRFDPKEKDTIIPKLQSLLPTQVTMEIIDDFPCHQTNPDNPFIHTLQEQSKKLYHRSLPLAMAYGTSDIPFFTEVGCEGIEFGPKGGKHHADNEWIDISSLEEYYQILKSFLLEIA